MTRLLCSTGCGLPVHHLQGQCIEHIDGSHVSGHPWTPLDALRQMWARP